MLHSGINLNQFVPELRMLRGSNLGIPPHRHEDSLDTASNGCDKDLTHLQSNQEGECHDNRRECSSVVVGRVREFEIQVSKKSAQITHEQTAHGEHRPDQAVVDESVDSAILHHLPGIFGSLEVRLAVESDVTECVSVDELNCPVQDAEKTLQTAEHASTDHVALRGLLRLGNTAGLTKHVDNGNDQAAQGNGSKAVGGRTLECTH